MISNKRSKGRCIYCGRAAKLTREHVIPDFLDKIVFPNGGLYFIGGANRIATGSVTVRDVCADCNNGVLADLDAHGSQLTKRYFKNLVMSETIRFEYDYNLLSRWLLKVTYNASRAFKAPCSAFENYIPYILGDASTPQTTVLLVGIWKPSFYKGKVYYPHDITFSSLLVPDKSGDLALSSMFSIQSYAFMLLGWGGKPSYQDVQHVTEQISASFHTPT